MAFATAGDGVRIHYSAVGRRSAPPILMIQGLGADKHGWALQRLAFSPTYRVLAHDNRGAGRSEKPSDGYTLEQMAEVIEGIVGLIARVRARWPAALMIVTSVPPIDPAQFGSMELVATVQRVNAAIAARAPALGARYLDIGAAMATTQGTLRPELSEDGVHLTEAAYLLWAATLRATLRGKAGR